MVFVRSTRVDGHRGHVFTASMELHAFRYWETA
jgi:peptide methionine sulfoxide reductase MsrB